MVCDKTDVEALHQGVAAVALQRYWLSLHRPPVRSVLQDQLAWWPSAPFSRPKPPGSQRQTTDVVSQSTSCSSTTSWTQTRPNSRTITSRVKNTYKAMDERTPVKATLLIAAVLFPAFLIVPTMRSLPANAPAIAWVPEVTVAALLGVMFFIGFLGEVLSPDVEDSTALKPRSYVWGVAGVAVSLLIVNLAFIPLTDNSTPFVAAAVGTIVGLVTLAYITVRAR